MTTRLSPTTESTFDIIWQRRPVLDVMLAPQTVALIGATELPGSVGRTLMEYLKDQALQGQVYLVIEQPWIKEIDINPLHLDSSPPTLKVADYFNLENRFKLLAMSKPEESEQVLQQAQSDAAERRRKYEYFAALYAPPTNGAKP